MNRNQRLYLQALCGERAIENLKLRPIRYIGTRGPAYSTVDVEVRQRLPWMLDSVGLYGHAIALRCRPAVNSPAVAALAVGWVGAAAKALSRRGNVSLEAFSYIGNLVKTLARLSQERKPS